MRIIYRKVVGYEDLYEVSNKGHVRSITREVVISNRHGNQFARVVKSKTIHPRPNKDGYPTVAIGVPRKHRPVHKLVADAFLGVCPEGKQVCHRDGTRHNSNIENLYYGTVKQNAEDRERHKMLALAA